MKYTIGRAYETPAADHPVPRKRRGARSPVFFSLAALAGLAAALLAACAEPVPLYGSWADNRGDTISFFDDGSFSATVVNSDKEEMNFNGTYTVLLNVLALSNSADNRQIVSEWDIRGNMLYLDWATEEGSIPLKLYKIAN